MTKERKKKYAKEILDRLIEVALANKEITANDINTYLNDLFEISQTGCWQRLRNEIIDSKSLTGKSYVKAMNQSDNLYELVKKDIENFKQQEITAKMSAFRIANFLDVDFTKYKQHEEKIKEVLGDKTTNRGREFILDIATEESKDYALLTKPVRHRFEVKFKSEIDSLRNQIANSVATPKATTISNDTKAEEQPRKVNKLKI